MYNKNLKSLIKIVFINQQGEEEAGIDGGGLFKEFLLKVCAHLFDPNYGFFVLTAADNTLMPNPSVYVLHK